MTSSPTQNDRPLRIQTRFGQDYFLLEAFSASERVSEPYRFRVRILSLDHAVDVDSAIGQAAVVSLDGAQGVARYFHGRFSSITQSGRAGEFAIYEAELVPWFWFLTLRTDCRIFSKMSVPEIVEKVFRDSGYSDFRIIPHAAYQPREYCVQYRESDFQFVSRLLEEEGLFYFFEHDASQHTMVISDHPAAFKDCPGQESARYDATPRAWENDDVVVTWKRERRAASDSVTLKDFNFEKPADSLLVTAGRTPVRELFDYPGLYRTQEAGDRQSHLRLEATSAASLTCGGKSVCRAFTAGRRFRLTGHFRADLDDTYTLLAVRHTAVNGSYRSSAQRPFSYRNRVEAMPWKTPYRPQRATPKPFVEGVQTAIVVGRPGEEIRPDQYGQVKVRFHWDRRAKDDENGSCSCWLRVSQTWAGQNWGAMHIPRVGQEVIVDFLEGDPARPIITGRVYNADQMPPWPLPAEQTKSGLRTRSSTGGDGSNYSEISFDDRKGAELLRIHAERDKRESVEHDSLEEVGHDRRLTVKHDQVELVEGDQHSTVKGERREKVEGDFIQEVAASRHEKVGSLLAVEAGTEIHLKAGSKLVLEAGDQLTVRGPGGFFVIDASGVTIQGTLVRINSSGGSAGEGSGVNLRAPKVPGAQPPPPASPVPVRTPHSPGKTPALAAIGLVSALKSRKRTAVKSTPARAVAKTSSAVLGALAGIPSTVAAKVKSWWDKGRLDPLHTKERESLFEVSGTKSREPGEKKASKSIGVEHVWTEKQGAIRKWGDDTNNFKLGSAGWSISSGLKREDGKTTVDLIKAKAHAEVASGEFDKGFAGDRLHVQGSGEVVSVEAEASAGVEFSKRAAGIHAKVGASANLVKGTLGGDIRIPLPFGHTLSLGGEAEGMIGAAAEASGGAGWSQSKGGFAHAKVKLGFGPGLGFGFKIGFK